MTIEEINKTLGHRFGKATDGHDRYRVVFSDDQIESSGEKKYYYINGKYVLEVFLEEHHSYEPLWTFSTREGNYLFPKLEWIEALLYVAMNPPKKMAVDYLALEEEESRKRIQDFYELLGGEDGLTDMKNQRANFVKPVFLARGDKNGI